MARKATPQEPDRPIHTVDQKRAHIERLRRRVQELEAFDPNTVTKRHSSPAVTQLQTAIAETLSAAFGSGTEQYRRYSSATRLDNGPISMGRSSNWLGDRGSYYDEAADARRYLTEGREKSLALLNQAIRCLEEEIELSPSDIVGLPERPETLASKRVFIVHGRSDGPRETVARFLERLGLEPIILHEQPNHGLTVIEKVENYSNVGFAIVLLTPDDEGNLRGDKPQPRARQNVLLELGCVDKRDSQISRGLIQGFFFGGGSLGLSERCERRCVGDH